VASKKLGPTLAAVLPWICLQSLETQLKPCTLESVKPVWSHAFGACEAIIELGVQRWSVFDGEALTSVDVHETVTGAMTLDGVEDQAQALAIHQRRVATVNFDRTIFWRLDNASLALNRGLLQPAWIEGRA
jgi:hypothetical protein